MSNFRILRRLFQEIFRASSHRSHLLRHRRLRSPAQRLFRRELSSRKSISSKSRWHKLRQDSNRRSESRRSHRPCLARRQTDDSELRARQGRLPPQVAGNLFADRRDLHSDSSHDQRSGGQSFEPPEPNTGGDSARHRQSQPQGGQSAETLDGDGDRRRKRRRELSRQPAEPSQSASGSERIRARCKPRSTKAKSAIE